MATLRRDMAALLSKIRWLDRAGWIVRARDCKQSPPNGNISFVGDLFSCVQWRWRMLIFGVVFPQASSPFRVGSELNDWVMCPEYRGGSR